MPEPGLEVEADVALVALAGARPGPGSGDVDQPAVEELGDRLPGNGDRQPLLLVPEDDLEPHGNLSLRPAVTPVSSNT